MENSYESLVFICWADKTLARKYVWSKHFSLSVLLPLQRFPIPSFISLNRFRLMSQQNIPPFPSLLFCNFCLCGTFPYIPDTITINFNLQFSIVLVLIKKQKKQKRSKGEVKWPLGQNRFSKAFCLLTFYVCFAYRTCYRPFSVAIKQCFSVPLSPQIYLNVFISFVLKGQAYKTEYGYVCPKKLKFETLHQVTRFVWSDIT